MEEDGRSLAQPREGNVAVVDLSHEFDAFYEAITLGKKQNGRIDSAFESLQTFLCEQYDVDRGAVFVQGSCANGTAVVPADPEVGEYDVDTVLVLPDGDVSSNEALDGLRTTLKGSKRYASRITTRKPCIRLQYADDEIGGFHVDVVPVRAAPISGDAPLEAPRRNEGWHETAPAEYTTWCVSQGELFQRTVKMLKRWRDENQDVRGAIKSIVLQVLVSRCMPPDESDALRIATTFTELQKFLQAPQPPEIPNPVLSSENLSARWTQEAFNSFRQEVGKAEAAARRAVEADDGYEAAAEWASIFGGDFPLPTGSSTGIVLADASHAKPISDQGWRENLNPDASISISTTVKAEDRRRTPIRDLQSDGKLVLAGWMLRFEASVVGGNGASVWWQVVNTGGHARSSNGLRGQFFKALTLEKQLSDDESVNWEGAQFTGSHWIEAFLVQGGTVIARSEPFIVNIRNPRRTFVR